MTAVTPSVPRTFDHGGKNAVVLTTTWQCRGTQATRDMSSSWFVSGTADALDAVRRPAAAAQKSPLGWVRVRDDVDPSELQVVLVPASGANLTSKTSVMLVALTSAGASLSLDAVGRFDPLHQDFQKWYRVWLSATAEFDLAVHTGPFYVFAVPRAAGSDSAEKVFSLGVTLIDALAINALNPTHGSGTSPVWYYYPNFASEPYRPGFAAQKKLGTITLVGTANEAEILLEEEDGTDIADAALVVVRDNNKLDLYQDTSFEDADFCQRLVVDGVNQKDINVSVRSLGLQTSTTVTIISVANPDPVLTTIVGDVVVFPDVDGVDQDGIIRVASFVYDEAQFGGSVTWPGAPTGASIVSVADVHTIKYTATGFADVSLDLGGITITENHRAFTPFAAVDAFDFTVYIPMTDPYVSVTAQPTGTTLTVGTHSNIVVTTETRLRSLSWSFEGVNAADAGPVTYSYQVTPVYSGLTSDFAVDKYADLTAASGDLVTHTGAYTATLTANAFADALGSLPALPESWSANGITHFAVLEVQLKARSVLADAEFTTTVKVAVFKDLQTQDAALVANTTSWESASISFGSFVRGGAVLQPSDYTVTEPSDVDHFRDADFDTAVQPYETPGVGVQTFAVTVEDLAGNTATPSLTFTWWARVAITGVTFRNVVQGTFGNAITGALGAALENGSVIAARVTDVGVVQVIVTVSGGYPGEDIAVTASVSNIEPFHATGTYAYRQEGSSVGVNDAAVTEPTGDSGGASVTLSGRFSVSGLVFAAGVGTYASAVMKFVASCGVSGTDGFYSTDSRENVSLVVFRDLVNPADVRGLQTGTYSTVYNYPASFTVGNTIISLEEYVSGGLALDLEDLSLSLTGTSAYSIDGEGDIVVAEISDDPNAVTITVEVAEGFPGNASVSGSFTIDRYLQDGFVALPDYDVTKAIGLLPQAATSDNDQKLEAVATDDGIKWTVAHVTFLTSTLTASVVYGDGDEEVVPYVTTEVRSSGATANVEILLTADALETSFATETRPLALKLVASGGEQLVEGEWVLTQSGVSRIGTAGETLGPDEVSERLIDLFNGSAFVSLLNGGGVQVQDVSAPLTLINYSSSSSLPTGTLDLYTSDNALFSTYAKSRVFAFSSGDAGILSFGGAAVGQYFVGLVPAESVSGLTTGNLGDRLTDDVVFVGIRGGDRYEFSSFVAERSTVGGAVVLRYYDGTTVRTIDKVQALVAPNTVATAATYKLVVLHVNGTLSLTDLSVTSVDEATSYLTQTGAMTAGQHGSSIIATVPQQPLVQHLQRYIVTVEANPTAEVFAANLLRRYTTNLTYQWPDTFRLDLNLSASGGSIQDDAGGAFLVYSLQARPIRDGPSGQWFIVQQSIDTAASSSDIVSLLQGAWPERDVAIGESGMIVPWSSTYALEYRLMCQNYAAYHDGSKAMVSLGTYAVTSHRSDLCNAQYYDYQVPGSSAVIRSTQCDSGGSPIAVESRYLSWETSVAANETMAPGFTVLSDVSVDPIYFIQD